MAMQSWNCYLVKVRQSCIRARPSQTTLLMFPPGHWVTGYTHTLRCAQFKRSPSGCCSAPHVHVPWGTSHNLQTTPAQTNSYLARPNLYNKTKRGTVEIKCLSQRYNVIIWPELQQAAVLKTQPLCLSIRPPKSTIRKGVLLKQIFLWEYPLNFCRFYYFLWQRVR